jgi:hypothetical protein
MPRVKLPYIDLKAWKGLFTKSSTEVITAEQLKVCENADFFQKYGAMSKIRGSSRVLAAKYSEGSGNIPWVGFYKASDLDGRILRDVLIAAGTTLQKVNSDGTLTQLATGRTDSLFHTYDTLDRFLFISNQDPDRVAVGDKMVKYDGSVISGWGITPPGSELTFPLRGEEELVIDTFDSASEWTSGPTGPTLSITDEPTDGTGTTFDGDAVALAKTAGNGKRFFIEKKMDNPFYPIGEKANLTSRDSATEAIPNRVNFFAYFNRGTLTGSDLTPNFGFTTSGPVLNVLMSPDSNTVEVNNVHFYFPMGRLVEGWNQLFTDFTSRLNVKGQFYPQSDRVKRVRFEYNLKEETNTVSGLRLDRFNRLNEGAPIAVPTGTAGTITGEYSYKVVYVSKYGQLSNAGPKSRDVTAASNTSIELTHIPTSSDPQVTGRRLYRTVANGSIWLFLDEIQDNTTTTYSDVVPDGSLGNETPPQAGDFSDDNSPPPKAGIVKVWKRTVFLAGDPQNPDVLYYSEDDEPESFPLINTFELDSKVTAIYETYSNLVVETETSKYQVIGDNPDFSLDKLVEGMGCVGPRAAGTARFDGYAVDRDGMRSYNTSSANKISEPIRDKYDELDRTNIELIHTVHGRNKNLIAQFNPDSTTISTGVVPTYDSIFAYWYVLDDVNQGYWTEIKPPSGINYLDAEEIEDSNGDFHIYAGGDDGMLYEIFDNDSKNWVDADGNTTAIDTIIQTPYIRAGELGQETDGVTGRVEPRFIEVRTEGDASVWTATIDMARGPDQVTPTDTSVVTMTFGANDSLQRFPIPSPGLRADNYFRIKLRNNEEDVFSRITAVRLLFRVHPFQGPETDVHTS